MSAEPTFRDDFQGQVAIVTGASYGLGRAIAEELLRRGACVMLTDIDKRLEQTAKELAQAFAAEDRVACIQLDVTVRSSIGRAVEETVSRFGKLSIFVNNAGWSKVMNPILEITADEWGTYMDINVRGNLFCIQEAAKAMIAGGVPGRVIAIASTAASKPYRRAAAYCTSKSAIPMLVKAAALELAEHGITVNCVAPGPTTTETNLAHSSGVIDPAVGEAKRRREALIPLGKNDPVDIAKAVAFFAQPSARRITGQHLIVEGGGLLLS